MKSYVMLTLVFLGMLERSGPYKGQAQVIPGKIEFEFYNTGGEGKGYHDTDKINNGSGKLNPANGTYLNEFRMSEGVDISYTKAKDIDNTGYNTVQPEMNSLYVGWTAPGEWIKYDVNVIEDGIYTVDLMYTSKGLGAIILNIDGYEALSEDIVTTNDPPDTVEWRQWHHWNKVDLGEVELKKGKHELLWRITDTGQMNFDYLEFKHQ
jgi:hypothetical protein